VHAPLVLVCHKVESALNLLCPMESTPYGCGKLGVWHAAGKAKLSSHRSNRLKLKTHDREELKSAQSNSVDSASAKVSSSRVRECCKTLPQRLIRNIVICFRDRFNT
jgi:hypothetical protein